MQIILGSIEILLMLFIFSSFDYIELYTYKFVSVSCSYSEKRDAYLVSFTNTQTAKTRFSPNRGI